MLNGFYLYTKVQFEFANPRSNLLNFLFDAFQNGAFMTALNRLLELRAGFVLAFAVYLVGDNLEIANRTEKAFYLAYDNLLSK